MSEDQNLLDRIGKLAGQINLHRTQAPSQQDVQSTTFAPASSWNKVVSASPKDTSSWRSPRVTPYDRGRGRGGRVTPNPHRHRSLVLNNKPGNSSQSGKESASTDAPGTHNQNVKESTQSANSWVTKRDRHMQLINSSIYDKDAQIRNKAIEETRQMRLFRRDQREKNKIQRHLQSMTPRAGQNIPTPAVHEITISGLRFHVIDGGSKLARIRGALDSTSSTPKQAIVGGVTFLRSKNGNFYRSGIVKAKKDTGKIKKTSEPCKRFTASGQCPKGPLCPYIHDPAKVAMCKDYLQTGACSAGESCDLSHEPTPERVPACLHFLRGKCSNPSCRYAHVRVNPSAPVCKDFATVGYCARGADCAERHVHECPDYANTGVCRKRKCHLPHVDRAGQIKKHTTNNLDSSTGSGKEGEDDESDIVSDDESDESNSDDVDSDGMEEMMDLSDGTASHAVSEQKDFVHL